MSTPSASASPHDDRLLVVIGASSGASVMLGRLVAAPGTDGASWLMVLVHAAVAAQGGAAAFWVSRALLRWLVGHVTASHAVRDAYAARDTATYAVFLLTLATALGVQIVAPVWFVIAVLFVAAQGRVLDVAGRTARRRPLARPGEGAPHATLAAGLAGAAGAASMLMAPAWGRMLGWEFGATAALASLMAAAVLAGLGLGVLARSRAPREMLGSALWPYALLQGAAGLWALASPTLVPRVAAMVSSAAPLPQAVTLLLLIGAPMTVTGLALATLPAARRADPRDGASTLAIAGAATVGAAAASVAAADVLFAFTGVRGVTWCGAGLSLTAAALALALPRMRRSAARGQS